ncbi:hypothetical protein [Thiocapsa bogorovii]|uniref:hypothetical protein n=1 Tax=Thiocapsa bogorovii TaxID=521689 RepID=UPI001E51FF98|nr:hypothetical protein [Thiocapsa bogorovii]UHD17392.1 hypothetical protein LT988_04905 [Thiocapsa bogorovii]
MASPLSRRVETLEKARGAAQQNIDLFGFKITTTQLREILFGLPQRSIGPKPDPSGERECLSP